MTNSGLPAAAFKTLADFVVQYPGRIITQANGAVKGSAVTKFSWASLPKVNIEKEMFEAGNGLFGTAKLVNSYHARWAKNRILSNARFLVAGGVRVNIIVKWSHVGEDDNKDSKSGEGGKAEKSGKGKTRGGKARKRGKAKTGGEAKTGGSSPVAIVTFALEDDPFGGLLVDHENPFSYSEPPEPTGKPKSRGYVQGGDIRICVVAVLAEEGVEFGLCESGADLRECLLHAVLGEISIIAFESLVLMVCQVGLRYINAGSCIVT